MRPSRTAINIVTAEPVGEYRLHLTFDDGMKQTVGFQTVLDPRAPSGYSRLPRSGRFSASRIEYGELVWGDYDLCFPIIDLYRNQARYGPLPGLERGDRRL